MYVNPMQDRTARDVPMISSILSALQREVLATRGTHEKRQFGYGYGYGYGYDGNSAWYRYGRWILLGALVGLALLIWLFVCGCNRRRTRTGQQPVKYTGWATPGFSHPQQSGVAEVQPYPDQHNQYSAPQNQYPMQDYSGSGNHGTAAPIAGNATYYGNENSAPPQYPVQTPAYPANVAPREK